jgi:hypothetical protein
MKLRPVFQHSWSGRPPPRTGRTAARFGYLRGAAGTSAVGGRAVGGDGGLGDDLTVVTIRRFALLWKEGDLLLPLGIYRGLVIYLQVNVISSFG